MKDKKIIKNVFRGILLGGICLLAVAGCASPPEMVKKVEPLPDFLPKQEIVSPAEGSIWPGENAANSLFVDNKARRVNDIITIVIDESSSGTNSADTSATRDSGTLSEISAFLGVEKSIARKNSNLTDGDINSAGASPSIKIGGSSSNSFSGKGSTSRDGQLTAKITAMVIKTLPNGNLVIAGKRRLVVNAENQFVAITGIIRPEDITSENVISSQYIADAKIIYTGNGVVNDKMRPGWMSHIVDWAWPF